MDERIPDDHFKFHLLALDTQNEMIGWDSTERWREILSDSPCSQRRGRRRPSGAS